MLTLAVGCSTTGYSLQYEVDEATATIWPPPPEIPRYRYVGELTGEGNLAEDQDSKGFGSKIADFFKMLLGISGPNPEPLVLQRPQTGTVDNEGRILVTDVSRHSVIIFDIAGGLITEWDSATPNINFVTPVGITIGKNNTILVVDADLKLVAQMDRDGKSVNLFGADVLMRPTGIARDDKTGRIYVSDTHAHNIKVFNDAGELVDTIGKRGTNIGEFNAPTHIAFANDNLYVTDTFNTRVQILTPKGEAKKQFGERGLFVGNLVRPKGVTSDSEGNIYVVESFHDHLLIYNLNGEFLLPIGGTGTEIGQFYLPAGVWADNNDRIYIADMFNGRVVILQYLGGKFRNRTLQKTK